MKPTTDLINLMAAVVVLIDALARSGLLCAGG